ncbi:MAG: hypothetical protein ACLPQS_01815 [Acidimicrobiales bacterium]
MARAVAAVLIGTAICVAAPTAGLAAGLGLRSPTLGPRFAFTSDSSAAGEDVLLQSDGVGWATVNNLVERTTDAGKNWKGVTPRSVARCQCLDDATYLGNKDAWVLQAGRQLRAWRTTDGGGHWTAGSPLPGVQDQSNVPQLDNAILFVDITFADPRDGAVLGMGGVLAPGTPYTLVLALWLTHDGGQTWKLMPLKSMPGEGTPSSFDNPCGHTASYGIDMPSASQIWLSDDGCGARQPGLWHSSNGAAWTPVSLPAPPGGWPKSAGAGSVNGVDVGSPQFVSRTTAFLPVTTGAGMILVYSTSDSGTAWHLAGSLDTGLDARTVGFDALSATTLALPSSDGTEWSSDGGRQWALQASPVSLGSVADDSFATREVGLALEGGLIKTNDGGTTWSERIGLTGYRDQGIADIDFLSRSAGDVAGAYTLYSTTNGGESLAAHPVPTVASSINQVDFVSQSVGWVLTGNELFSTVDGGKHLEPVAEPAEGSINSIDFFTATDGYASLCGVYPSYQAVLLRTTDAGASWSRVGTPRGAEAPCLARPAGGFSSSGDVCFSSWTEGWYLSDGSRLSFGKLYRTDDGGHRWQLVSDKEPSIPLTGCAGGQLWGYNVSEVGAGSENFAVFTSSNGATPWRAVLALGPVSTPPGTASGPDVPHPASGEFGGVDEVSSRIAWEIGSSPCGCTGPAFAATVNAGRSWTYETTGAKSPLAQVSNAALVDFLGSKVGFVAGQSYTATHGNVFSTTNGGRSWQRRASVPDSA